MKPIDDVTELVRGLGGEGVRRRPFSARSAMDDGSERETTEGGRTRSEQARLQM